MVDQGWAGVFPGDEAASAAPTGFRVGLVMAGFYRQAPPLAGDPHPGGPGHGQPTRGQNGNYRGRLTDTIYQQNLTARTAAPALRRGVFEPVG